MCIEQRFSRGSKFYAEYASFVDDILKKGYAVKLDITESFLVSASCSQTSGQVSSWLCVVFDCGASFEGTLLNQQGPDLTNSLVGVLVRFRQTNIVVMADMEAMFHQVRVIVSSG